MSKKYSFLYQNKKYYKINYLGQIYQIYHKLVICNYCNFIYTNPFIGENNNKKLYESSVIGKAFERTKKSVIHFQTFSKLFSNINKNIKSVFEVGTATGNLLRDVTKKYKIKKKNAYGIEPSKNLVKQLKKNPFFKINNLFLNNLKIKKKFDIIILDNVLEHIEDPNEGLKKIKNQFMNNNSLLYISVPNTLKVPLNFRDPFGHTCNYYRNNLIYLLNKNGFKIEFIKLNKWISLIAKKGNKNKNINLQNDRKMILRVLKKKIAKINHYRNNLKLKLKKIEKLIKKNNQKILIYGVGNYCLELMLNMNIKKNIVKLIDQNPIYHKRLRFGYKVISPKKITDEKFDKIIIASGKFTEDIINQLKILGIKKNKIIKI